MILNLPKSFTRQELIAMFRAYGPVSSCELVMDAKSGLTKGFGFITMRDKDSAEQAIAALHGKKIGGQKIRVKPAEHTKA